MHGDNDLEELIARRAGAQVAVSVLRDRVLQVISKSPVESRLSCVRQFCTDPRAGLSAEQESSREW